MLPLGLAPPSPGSSIRVSLTSVNEVGIGLLQHWLAPADPPVTITHAEVLGVVPLEVADALLDTLRTLADKHERGFMVEHVMELLA